MKFPFRKRNDEFDYEQERTCLTCDQVFQGRYCGRCGEKVINPKERSVRNFLGDVLNAFTFLDGKFPRSVKSILLNPGKLSLDVVHGVRVPYMKPVSLFFLANFLYFLLPLSEAFNTSLNSQLTGQLHSEMVKRMVDAKLEAHSITSVEFETRYNEASASRAKLLIVIIVFLFSIILGVVNFSKERYYADHLAVSFEYMAFTLVYVSIILISVLIGFMATIQWLELDLMWLFRREHTLILPLTLLSIFYFLWRMQMKFYGNTKWVGLLKALLLLAGFALTVMVYRFILFFVTFWSV